MKNLKTKISILSLLFVGASSIFAQTHRFHYLLHQKLTADIYRDTPMVLDIDKKQNTFFPEIRLTDEFGDAIFSDILIAPKTGNLFTFIKNLSYHYYQYTSPVDIQWKISAETKNIGEFKVQKATATYADREWVAWYCSDIPLPYGPYFFQGLPGLILEVSDTENNFHFLFTENKKFDKDQNSLALLEKTYKHSLSKIQKKDWAKVQQNYYQSPLKEYRNGEAYMTDENGERYTDNDYREMEKDIQYQIKAINNPLELSEKVDYKD